MIHLLTAATGIVFGVIFMSWIMSLVAFFPTLETRRMTGIIESHDVSMHTFILKTPLGTRFRLSYDTATLSHIHRTETEADVQMMSENGFRDGDRVFLRVDESLAILSVIVETP